MKTIMRLEELRQLNNLANFLMAPCGKLKFLPKSEKYLKDGVTFEIMDNIAYAITDNESADRLQKARQQLFKTIDERELNTG